MTYRALLIGNSVFDADASLRPLNAPVKDVARLHRALVDSDTGMFAEDDVRLVTERTCDALLDELDQFFAAAGRDDLLLLYYSGHGLLDERNRLYLCGRDTRSDRLLRTAVSNVRINEFVTQSLCRRTVIILDCCSSGMFKAGGSIETQLAGPGRYIVSSTRGRELANDAAAPTGTSLFTEHLVQGLLGAAPDTNGDGYLDLREVYDYVRDRLRETSKQVPHCRFDGDAAVSLARVRAAPAVARAVIGERFGHAAPTFALAENIITLRDLEVGDELPPETVEVLPLIDEPLDLSVDTDDDWLTVSVADRAVIVVLAPRLGRNQGKATVRDRRSGTAQVLRVEARVRPTSAVPAQSGEVPTTPPSDLVTADPTGLSANPEPDAGADTLISKGPSANTTPTNLDHAATATPDAAVEIPRRTAPAAAWRATVTRPVGLVVALIGAVLLCIAFGGADWYGPADGQRLDVSGLRSAAAAFPGGGFGKAIFSGVGWLLVAVSVLLAVLACLRTPIAAVGLRVSAAFVALLGIVLSLLAVNNLIDAALRAGQTVSGLFDDTRSGLFLMMIGFGLVAVSTIVPAHAGRLRRGLPKGR